VKILPFSTQTQACNVIANPTYSTAQSPIGCSGSLCQSYLLSGGLVLTTPWPPTNHAGSPAVVVENVVAQQIDFQQNVGPEASFEEADCSTYSDNGTTLIAMKVCVAPSRVAQNSLATGKIFQSIISTSDFFAKASLCVSTVPRITNAL
jgi:hypothetical protein